MNWNYKRVYYTLQDVQLHVVLCCSEKIQNNYVVTLMHERKDLHHQIHTVEEGFGSHWDREAYEILHSGTWYQDFDRSELTPDIVEIYRDVFGDFFQIQPNTRIPLNACLPEFWSEDGLSRLDFFQRCELQLGFSYFMTDSDWMDPNTLGGFILFALEHQLTPPQRARHFFTEDEVAENEQVAFLIDNILEEEEDFGDFDPWDFED